MRSMKPPLSYKDLLNKMNPMSNYVWVVLAFMYQYETLKLIFTWMDALNPYLNDFSPREVLQDTGDEVQNFLNHKKVMEAAYHFIAGDFLLKELS